MKTLYKYYALGCVVYVTFFSKVVNGHSVGYWALSFLNRIITS